MSVRKVYDVLFDGQVIWSGSYASAVSVYESTMRALDFVFDNIEHTVVIAFAPKQERSSDNG